MLLVDSSNPKIVPVSCLRVGNRCIPTISVSSPLLLSHVFVFLLSHVEGSSCSPAWFFWFAAHWAIATSATRDVIVRLTALAYYLHACSDNLCMQAARSTSKH